ncbi:MAG: pantoate--beta-alanine ligase [Thermoleophilia bacterium]
MSRVRQGTATITRTVAETREALAALPRPLGLVPTMGALHEGHLALAGAAARECASVVMSIFVNPTQFGPGEDLARYPRDEAHDAALATEAGVTLIFAPPATEMYRPGATTTVHVDGPLTSRYEAAERPGHLDGVATIVTKLLTIVAPDRAYFGRKDAQQLAVVRRLVSDLDLPVEVVAVDTVREPDGLAMSSRNVYLTPEQRAKAAELHRALLAGRAVAAQGARAVVAEVTARLVVGFPPYLELAADPDGPQRPLFSVDYVAVVDPDSFAPLDELGPDAVKPENLIIAAARLDAIRLIDNVAVGEAAFPQTTTPHEPDPHGGPASDRKE